MLVPTLKLYIRKSRSHLPCAYTTTPFLVAARCDGMVWSAGSAGLWDNNIGDALMTDRERENKTGDGRVLFVVPCSRTSDFGLRCLTGHRRVLILCFVFIAAGLVDDNSDSQPVSTE